MKRNIPIGALLRDEDNPELGAGHLLEISPSGRASVEFQSQLMSVDLSQRPLRRQKLPPGARVLHEEGEGRILSVKSWEDPEQLFYYRLVLGEMELECSEADLLPAPPRSQQPLDLLESRSWRGPFHFIARKNACASLGEWGEISEGCLALIGGRRSLTPELLFAIRSALWSDTGRSLLFGGEARARRDAACWILQVRHSEDPGLRVLILTSGLHTALWQSSLSLHFGGQSYGLMEMDAEPFEAETERLICSYGAFRQPELLEALEMEPWDLIICDDLQILSGGSLEVLQDLLVPELIALSAAPDLEEVKRISQLLSLLKAPEPTLSPKVLSQHLRAYRPIWEAQVEIQEAIKAGEPVPSKARQAWSRAQDPNLKQLLKEPDSGPLLEYSRCHHRLDPGLLALSSSKPSRVEERLSYQSSPGERVALQQLQILPEPSPRAPNARLLSALYRRAFMGGPGALLQLLEARAEGIGGQADGGFSGGAALDAFLLGPSLEEEETLIKRLLTMTPPMSGEYAWLLESRKQVESWAREGLCARFSEAITWLAQQKGKLIGVCRSEISALALHRGLTLRYPSMNALLITRDQPEERRVRSLREFRKKAQRRLLILDETMAQREDLSALTLLHVEPSLSLTGLSERLNRLRPIRGQRSVSLCGPMPEEQQLLELQAPLHGAPPAHLERIINTLDRRLISTLGSGSLKSLQPFFEERLEALGGGSSLLLKAHGPTPDRLEQEEELSEMIQDVSEELSERDARFFVDWAQTLGIRARRDGDRVGFHWRPSELRRPLPRLREMGIQAPVDVKLSFPYGSFDRLEALDESLQFFAPGHRFLDSLLDDLRESTHGRLSIFQRSMEEERKGDLHLVLLMHLSPRLDRDLPQGLQRRTLRQLWPRWESLCFHLHPEEGLGFSHVEDPALIEILEAESRRRAQKLEAETLIEAVDYPALLKAVRDCIQFAEGHCREENAAEAEEASEALHQDLQAQLRRLRWRQAEGQEVERLEAEKEILLFEQAIESLRYPQIKLEALALVMGA